MALAAAEAAGGAGAGLPHGVSYFVCAVYSLGKCATLLGRLLPKARAAARGAPPAAPSARPRRARDAHAARRGGGKVPDLPRVSSSRAQRRARARV
jgi:hypothetical protein